MMKHHCSARQEDKWTVHCDSCGKATPQENFEMPGDASDHARRANFTTQFKNSTTPATWHCPDCSTPKAVGSA